MNEVIKDDEGWTDRRKEEREEGGTDERTEVRKDGRMEGEGRKKGR